MSDTPRTDANVITDEFDDRLGDEGVTAEFARQLERDLARVTAEMDALLRGEFICKQCGLRKDGEHEPVEF